MSAEAHIDGGANQYLTFRLAGKTEAEIDKAEKGGQVVVK